MFTLRSIFMNYLFIYNRIILFQYIIVLIIEINHIFQCKDFDNNYYYISGEDDNDEI